MKYLLGLWLAMIVMLATPTISVANEEGAASYYADSLQGNSTASGEPYDRNEMTAAHRTLAFGTKVRVTNLDNGKSVVVRINDRGPHADSRIIDLSGAAAERIGILDTGEANVRIEVVN
jgi:rare lipoprotein A